MAKDMLNSHLRLIQSALGQKVEAEPVGNHRGRSQGRPAMGGHEVASFPGEAGPPLGQSRIERASPLRAKFDLSASLATDRAAAQAVSGSPTALVTPAATPSTQHVRFTDEVPRRPGPQGLVSLGYKSRTKGPTRRRRERLSPGPALRDVSSARVEAGARGASPPPALALKGKTSECRLNHFGSWDQLAQRTKPPIGPRGPPPLSPPAR
jgi:hypothetical protein